MKIKQIIGIDVSKLSLDVHLHLSERSARFDNTADGIAQMVTWCTTHSGCKKEDLFFVFEHTGLYSHHLAKTLRARLVKQRSGYKVCLKEQKRVLPHREYQVLFQVQDQLIGRLNVHIKKVEPRIKAIIGAAAHLKCLYQLIISVKGVGPQTACHFIVFTHGFTRFTSWRAFATYAGTALFPYRSASSIRGKNKVSHLANKKMKSLLDMCTKSAIQYDRQLKGYYQRKVDQGKQKMSVINAVRNKIIARVLAVVNRKSPFVDTYKFAA